MFASDAVIIDVTTPGEFNAGHIENSKNIENVYVELYSYNYINCQNNRKVCPICKGTSVMIIETDISKIYKTCPFSDNKGFLTCDEYNLFLRGKLKPKTSN